MNPLQIAKLCHEINKAYCEATGDNTQKSWEDSSSWQRGSAMAGVLSYMEGRIKTPEDAHNEWMRNKSIEGWQYGFVKSEATKEHPCMVPYAELSKEQKIKDYLFHAIVKTCNECEDDNSSNRLYRISKVFEHYKRNSITREEWEDILSEILKDD